VNKAPRVNVLGRVEIAGLLAGASSNRRARATEFVAYLALHPGASANEIDEAIWPGRRVAKEMRNSFVSRVRHWLGNDSDGRLFLPLVGDHGDYRLSSEFDCDWHDFLRLAREGLARGPNGADLLEQALTLVRGRPFLGIDPTTYSWAEADAQEMISAIVDVANVLSTTRLEQGDTRAAQDAAARGLLAEPGSELLHCDAIRAAAARGDSLEIARLSDRLRRQIESIDPDGGVGEATVKLLQELSVDF
jgi:two-component SAPR family response regulator